MSFIISFDWAILQFFEKLWNPVCDVIMVVSTYLGEGGICWIVLGLALLISKKTRKIGFLVLMGLIFASVINVCLKEIIQRPRPFNFTGWPAVLNYPGLVAKPTSWSFPSGHTASSFGAALPVLMRCKKKYGIPAIIVAILISISRIYLHVHYPTDVIVGCIVGLIGGFLAVLAYEKILPKLAEKFRANKMKAAK